jgi:hypothetical protein
MPRYRAKLTRRNAILYLTIDEAFQMSSSNESEKGKWRLSHVSNYSENVCETFTDEKGKIHYRWLYPDGKIEYICACHRFLNK